MEEERRLAIARITEETLADIMCGVNDEIRVNHVPSLPKTARLCSMYHSPGSRVITAIFEDESFAPVAPLAPLPYLPLKDGPAVYVRTNDQA